MPRIAHLKIDINGSGSEERVGLNQSGRASEEDKNSVDEEEGVTEFKKVIKYWMKHSKAIEWKKLNPELKTDGN